MYISVFLLRRYIGKYLSEKKYVSDKGDLVRRDTYFRVLVHFFCEYISEKECL